MKLTEQPSPHRHVEKRPIEDITSLINKEDATVAAAIQRVLPAINLLIHGRRSAHQR